MTEPQKTLTSAHLKTPRAAAIAGIIFSVLLIVSLLIMRSIIPSGPKDTGKWLIRDSKLVTFALDLLPFAGIAFLWFIGVIRDRMGEYEDRFFATVFLGSGFLFLAMLFACSAIAESIIALHKIAPDKLQESGIFMFGRAITYQLMHFYTMKMAGVFIISTCTLAIRTGILPKWISVLGYVLAIILILSVGYFHWVPLVFPLWILLVSIYVLFSNLKKTGN